MRQLYMIYIVYIKLSHSDDETKMGLSAISSSLSNLDRIGFGALTTQFAKL